MHLFHFSSEPVESRMVPFKKVCLGPNFPVRGNVTLLGNRMISGEIARVEVVLDGARRPKVRGLVSYLQKGLWTPDTHRGKTQDWRDVSRGRGTPGIGAPTPNRRNPPGSLRREQSRRLGFWPPDHNRIDFRRLKPLACGHLSKQPRK